MNDSELNDRFCGCSPATLDAIRTYRSTRDVALVSPIFHGILEKYSPEAVAASGSDDALNAFGLESLTLMELILDLQDALAIRFEDAELKRLQNVKDATALLMEKVTNLQRQSVVPS